MDKYDNEFYTMKGYVCHTDGLTASMEDYLEMIYRLSQSDGVIRINELATKLNVRPSSASKMAVILKGMELLSFRKYGYILLTDKGKKAGEYLLYRHETIHAFLCVLNKTDNELEQAEKIEHYFDADTVENIAKLTQFLKSNPIFLD